MKIQNTNNTFKAKVPINTRTILKKTPLYKQYTPIDAMFNENAVVKSLDNFSVFVKNKILCRYFNNPKNFIEKRQLDSKITAKSYISKPNAG